MKFIISIIILLLTAMPPAAKTLFVKRVLDSQKLLTRIIEGHLSKNVDVGIRIETLDGKKIYGLNDEKLFIPASAIKVFTSAVAMIRFGAGYRFETPVWMDENDLYLQGKGDPALRHQDLEKAARVLKNKGIDEIPGDIVYDVSFIDRENPRYEPNARHYYAPPGAITVNFNWLPLELMEKPTVRLKTIPETAYAQLDYDIKVSPSRKPGRPAMTYRREPWGDVYRIKGTVTEWDKKYDYLNLCVTRPGLFGATLLKEALERNGIRVRGSIREGRVPHDAQIVTTMKTPVITDVLDNLNKESNNVVAELLVKDLGAYFLSKPGTREKGLRIVRKLLREEIGFTNDSYVLADASGLSKQNRFSPRQFTKALNYFYEKLGEKYVRILVPQGYHRHARFPVPPQGMRVYVKSGTLSVTGVNTVVGYIFIDETGEGYSFAILCNRHGPGPMAYSGTYTNPILSEIIKEFTKNPAIQEG